jgi:hypothetical protein
MTHVPVVSYSVDEKTDSLLRKLRALFDVKTNEEVIRRSLALSNIVMERVKPERTITISSDVGQRSVVVAVVEGNGA